MMAELDPVIVTNWSSNNSLMMPVLTDEEKELAGRIVLQQLYPSPFAEMTQTVFIIFYSILIAFGSAGNGLVCYVVVKNHHMRTPRNIFIINLAFSDLTLCLFTQPLNLYRLIQPKWGLGAVMCRVSTLLQGTNVFVSTISITAIALDRFQVIVYPTKDNMKKIGAAAALISIWVISFIMASPLLIFSYLEVKRVVPYLDFKSYRCVEDVELTTEKGAYSVASMVVQYILPILIVSVAHLRICYKLKYRMVNKPGSSSSFQKKKSVRNNRRKRKTNILLAMIAIVFALSWLPLNICNILSEMKKEIFTDHNINITLAYAICHMLVLSSACTNPVLYGWLNDNFKTEFMKVLCCPCCVHLKNVLRKLACCFPNQQPIPEIVFTKDVNTNGCSATNCEADHVSNRTSAL